MTMLSYLYMPFYSVLVRCMFWVSREERLGRAIENMIAATEAARAENIPMNQRSSRGQRRKIRQLIEKIMSRADYAVSADTIIPALRLLCEQLNQEQKSTQEIAATISVYMWGRQERGVQYGAHDAGVTSRVPPAWAPEGERHYSFAQYCQDITLWAASTDVDAIRIGPVVAMRLQGSAKIVARELDAQQLANGILIPHPDGGFMMDPINGQQVPAMQAITGLQFLMRQLRRRYAPLDQEVQIQAIADLFHFRRYGSETTDELIARFELCIHKAANMGQVVVGEPIQAWMLLSALQVPRDKWQLLLAPTQGALPLNQQQYMDFVAYLRRQGHLTDHNRDKSIQQQFWGQSSDMWSYHGAASDQSHYDDPYPTFNYPTLPVYQSDAADELSSGCSNDDEPVDYSTEIAGVSQEEAGELLYLGYRGAKRKFRRFTGQPSRIRGVKGKGKGKGKYVKGKGKGKPAFLQDGSEIWVEEPHESASWQITSSEYIDPAYAFQKGASKGAGKGRRGNPIGPDGLVMKCTICKSEEHFQRFCPRNPNPKGAGGGKGSAPASSGYTAHWSQQQGIGPGSAMPIGQYFGGAQEEQIAAATFQASIEYADGSSEVLRSTEQHRSTSYSNAEQSTPTSPTPQPKAMPSHLSKIWSYFSVSVLTWWNSEVFHARVKLANGKVGALVDCGAIDNMAGDVWVKQIESRAASAGQGSVWSSIRPLSVEGVGSGASQASSAASVPVCLSDGTIDVFKTIVCGQSELPGLYGLKGLTENSAIIDTGNDRLIYPGPGGIKFVLSPGSKVYMMERAVSGHLMLPICEWQSAKGNSHGSRGGKSLF